tara:strand:+ start:5513 stop:5911 length:399 start_codon:yes stop_codon:yes gene_type:complete
MIEKILLSNKMLTILKRIFPYDISEYIYQIYKNDAIEVIMYPKLYTLELILDNFIKIKQSEWYNRLGLYSINNIDGMKFVKKVFQLIKKYNYKVDKQLDLKIFKFRDILQNIIKKMDSDDQIIYSIMIKQLL